MTILFNDHSRCNVKLVATHGHPSWVSEVRIGTESSHQQATRSWGDGVLWRAEWIIGEE